MSRKASLKTLRLKTWKTCSLYARQLYADHRGMVACYTCDKVGHWKEMDAGHAIDGRHNAVLFDMEIIRPQCDACNRYKHGNHKIFTYKLIKEHSLEWWEQKLAASRLSVKFTRDDYENMALEFKSETARIKKEAGYVG